MSTEKSLEELMKEKWANYGKPADIIPITPETPTNVESLTFSEALEQAFWQSGGISLLNRVANENPLEFLKICAKLIPVEMKGIDSNAGVTIMVNTLEEKSAQSIEHESTKE